MSKTTVSKTTPVLVCRFLGSAPLTCRQKNILHFGLKKLSQEAGIDQSIMILPGRLSLSAEEKTTLIELIQKS